jgi:catechol 2,3-dioxygenase-like lactoylglutathione lyase family enzyme
VTDRFQGRFDHAVILVPDLAAAQKTYEQLGFAVSPGGRHEGLGTHNALIRFGVDYLELLAVHDRDMAMATDRGKALVDLIGSGRGGLASFALATTQIENDAERFARTGLATVGPFAMKRMRPDAKLLSWRLLVPHGSSWRVPWPFFIQWDQSDGTRLSWERAGGHANGATQVVGVSVAVRDLDAAADLYDRQLGIDVSTAEAAPAIGGRRRVATLGSCEIALCGPAGSGEIADRLRDVGEGIYEVALATAGAPRLIRADEALGARLALRPSAKASMIHQAAGTEVLAWTSA